MIVKVQLALRTTAKHARVLVYNEDRSVSYEGEAAPRVKYMMHGRHKAFFHAKLADDGVLLLERDATDQDW